MAHCAFQKFIIAIVASTQVFSSLAFAQNSAAVYGATSNMKENKPALSIQIPFDFETGTLFPNLSEANESNDPSRVELSPAEIRQQENDLKKFMIDQELRQRGSPTDRLKSQFPSIQHLGIETGYFQIVLGAMAIQETYLRGSLPTNKTGIDSHGKNPVAYEQFVNSLEDPVSHLSFYSFMVANGATVDWLSDPRIAFRQKVVYSKAIIPGLGMTAGSVVSQLTGEFAQTLKACYYDTIKKTNNRKALGLSEKEPKKISKSLYEEKDPCQEAWHQWTAEKKFYTYAPAITSMLFATLAGTVSQQLIRLGAYTLRKGAKYGSGAIAIGLEKAVSAARFAALKQVTLEGMDLAVNFGRGGVFKATVKFVTKIANISGFLGSDHMFKDGTNWVIGNWLRSGDHNFLPRALIPGKNFDELGEDLFNLINSEKNDSWNITAEKYLSTLKDEMEEWRKLNNQDVESAHGLWMQKINGFTVSSRLAKNYYGQIIEDLKKSYLNSRLPTKKDDNTLPPQIAWDWSHRVYPLYGITPTADAAIYPNSDVYSNDYLLNPDRIEKFQLATLRSALPILCDNFNSPEKAYRPQDIKFLNENCGLLKSSERIKIGEGLTNVGRVAFSNQALARESIFVSDRLQINIRKFRLALGDPRPLMNRLEGFSYAFDLNTLVRANAEVFPEVQMGRYKKEKISDYMAFKMICGAESVDQIIIDGNGYSLQFNPPKIVSIKKPQDFCNNEAPTLENSIHRSALIYRQEIRTETAVYRGVGDLIYSNLTPEIQNLITNPNEEENFNQLWDNKYGSAITNSFESLEKEYVLVQRRLIDNLSQRDSVFNKGVVGNSLLISMKQELRVNLMFLGELLKILILQQPKVITEVGFYANDADLSELSPNISNAKVRAMSDLSQFGKSGILRSQQEPLILDPMIFINANSPRVTIKQKIFQFQLKIEKILKLQESLLLGLKIKADDNVNLNYNNTNSPEEFAQYMTQIQSLLNEKVGLPGYFHKFTLTPSQEKLLQTSVMNIGRILSLSNTYITMAESIRYDSNLRNDNTIKPQSKSKTSLGGRIQGR